MPWPKKDIMHHWQHGDKTEFELVELFAGAVRDLIKAREPPPPSWERANMTDYRPRIAKRTMNFVRDMFTLRGIPQDQLNQIEIENEREKS